MQNSPFARGHGREMVRRAGLSNFVGCNARRQTQFFEPRFAMSHAVKADFFVLVARKAKHFHGQQFERAKQFGATLEQKRSIWAGELYENFGTLPVAVLSHGRINGDAILQLESCVLDHAGEKGIELVCRFDFVHKKKPSAFSRQLSAKPPNSNTTAKAVAHSCYFSRAKTFLTTTGSYRWLRADDCQLLSFFLALLAAISRISRPSVVRFMIDCWVIIIKLLSA